MDRVKEDVVEWLNKHKTEGGDYMKYMKDFVRAFEDKPVSLKNPVGAEWVICDLNGTIYENNEDEVMAWEKFYLPDEVKMQVIGKVTGTSYPCEQLVLMTCEDGNIYAYDEEEELHVVASSPEQLCSEGLQDPASLSYYKGQAFKDLTNEDWKEVRQSEVGKRVDREHAALVNEHKSHFLESLKNGASEAKKSLKMPERKKKTETIVIAQQTRLRPMRSSSEDFSKAYEIRDTLEEMKEEFGDGMRQKLRALSSSPPQSSSSSSSGYSSSASGAIMVLKIPERKKKTKKIVRAQQTWIRPMRSPSEDSSKVYESRDTMEEMKEEFGDGMRQKFGALSLSPSSSSSSSSEEDSSSEHELEWLMRQLMGRLKGLILSYVLERSVPSVYAIREILDEMEKNIFKKEYFMRQKSGTLSSPGDSSSEGTTQMWAEESKEGTKQSLSSRSLADVFSTKRWADPSRAFRVRQITEQMEEEIKRNELKLSEHLLSVKGLMEKLKEAVKDVFPQMLASKSVGPTLEDSSHQTKAVITPDSKVKSLMKHLEWMIQYYLQEKRWGSSEISAYMIRHILDELEKKIVDGMRQTFGTLLLSGDSSSEGATQILTEYLSKEGTKQSDVLSTKQWAHPSQILQIIQKLKSEIGDINIWKMSSFSSIHSSSVERLIEALKDEIEDDVRQKMGLEPVRPTQEVFSHQTEAVSPPDKKVKGKVKMK